MTENVPGGTSTRHKSSIGALALEEFVSYRVEDREDRSCIFIKSLKTFNENEVIVCFDKEKKEFIFMLGTESIWLSLKEIKKLLDVLQNWIRGFEK